jgi:hypothetical protein
VPDEVEVLDEKTALDLVAEAKDEDGVFASQKLTDRWNPVALVEDKVDVESTVTDSVVTSKKAVFCPTCHQFIMWFPENITAKTINLTCPVGHKVVLRG